MQRFALVLVGLVACTASAESSSSSDSAVTKSGYRFEIRARGSEDPDVSAFTVPNGVYIKDLTPSINERGDMTFDFGDADDIVHIWKNGEIIHVVPDPKAVVVGTSLDEAGNVAFDVMGGKAGNGLFRYDNASHQVSFFASEPLGAESWLDVRLLDDGRIGCRPGGAGHHYVGYVDPDGFRKVAVEQATTPSSPYQYLFSPKFDRQGNVAFKVMLASGGEEIRFFKPGAPPVTLAQDTNANPASTMKSIDNGLAMADNDDIAFIAKVDGKRTVFRIHEGVTTRIAAEGTDDIGTLSFFAPALDTNGHVVFKGEDTQRRNTIWISDGTSVSRLVTAGDSLPTDQGDALALPETEVDATNRTTFGGGLVMNGHGQIVFSAALAKDNGRFGTGIYVASPMR